MKTIMKIILVLVFIILQLDSVNSQGPPNPNDPSIGGGGYYTNGQYGGPGNGPIGGSNSASLPNGVGILLFLSMSYGIGKVFQIKKNKKLQGMKFKY